jgi:hypothetical protein
MDMNIYINKKERRTCTVLLLGKRKRGRKREMKGTDEENGIA